MQYGRRYSAEGDASVTFGSAVCVWACPKESPRWVSSRPNHSWFGQESFSIGAKAGHRQHHRARPGSVHSSRLVQVATGGRTPKLAGTEGTTRRITASSQPRDSAPPCVIRSRIAAPKEEGPGSVQRGGGKAKYRVWSDAGTTRQCFAMPRQCFGSHFIKLYPRLAVHVTGLRVYKEHQGSQCKGRRVG